MIHFQTLKIGVLIYIYRSFIQGQSNYIKHKIHGVFSVSTNYYLTHLGHSVLREVECQHHGPWGRGQQDEFWGRRTPLLTPWKPFPAFVSDWLVVRVVGASRERKNIKLHPK